MKSNRPLKKSALVSSLTWAGLAFGLVAPAFAQSVVYRENFTYDAADASTLAQMGWTQVWDGPFGGTTHTGFNVVQVDSQNGAAVGSAPSVTSSPAVSDGLAGYLYVDMQYRNPPNDLPNAVLVSTTEVAALNLVTSSLSSISFFASDLGYGNETWAEPFTGRVALQVGGTWYVSNTPLVVNNSVPFQERSLNFDSGTWATIADPSVALTFSGTGALAVGTVQAAGLLITQPDNAAYVAFDQFTITAIPEPASVAMLAGLGVLGLVAMRRRRAG